MGRSFLSVTSHCIQSQTVETPSGPVKKLVLRSDLIGFVRLPGSHAGEHISEAFVYVLDRLGLLRKVTISFVLISVVRSLSFQGGMDYW